MRRDIHLMLPGVMRRCHCASRDLAVAGAAGVGLLGGGSLFGSRRPPPRPALRRHRRRRRARLPSRTRSRASFPARRQRRQQSVAGATPDIDCPLIDIREGASTLTIGPTGTDGDATTTRDGAEISGHLRARRARMRRGRRQMVMKVGVEGRIIVGPAGGPGQVDVPLRIAVVEETTARHQADRHQAHPHSGDGASATDNPTFTHIEDGLTFPMPQRRSRQLHRLYRLRSARRRRRRTSRSRSQPKPKPKAKPTAKTGVIGCQLYQPRRSVIVLLSTRMSAITVRAPALTRSWASRPGI